MILIGSTAANIHFNGKWRKPKDRDFLCFVGEDVTGAEGEDCIFVPKHLYDMIDSVGGVITKEHLLSLKLSHLCRDWFWDKHFSDVASILRMGISFDEKVVSAFRKHWDSESKAKASLSLGKRKTEFFNDFVKYRIDHDVLHEVVASPEQPAYKQCLKDGKDVLTCPEKFSRMSPTEQIRMFREEITVIALERFILGDNNSVKTTMLLPTHRGALRKCCTNLTKNWATDFILFNIQELSKPCYKTYNRVIDNWTKGKIK